MLYRDVAQLIDTKTVTDPDGYRQETETRTEVYVDVQSVKRGEFYSGRQAGVELVISFMVRVCDFGGQRLIEYDGKRYRVVRAYTKDGELLELNCSEEKGHGG